METGNCKTWCQALLIHFMRWYWNALILNKFTGSSEFGEKIKCSRVHIARDGSKKRWCLCVLLIVQTKGKLEDAHIARDPRQRGFPGPLSHKWLYPLERSYRIKTIFNNDSSDRDRNRILDSVCDRLRISLFFSIRPWYAASSLPLSAG